MRLDGVQPGDTIEAEVRGRVFAARVVDLDCDDLPHLPIRVEPLSRANTHYHLAASHIKRRIDPPPRKRRAAA